MLMPGRQEGDLKISVYCFESVTCISEMGDYDFLDEVCPLNKPREIEVEDENEELEAVAENDVDDTDTSIVHHSRGELDYILGGISTGLRSDGRRLMQCREIGVEPHVSPSSMGSARANLGETEVLVKINGDITSPLASAPDAGIIDFFLSWTPLCSKGLDRFQEDESEVNLEEYLTEQLKVFYGNMDLKQLCLVQGHKVWKLNVDILIQKLEGGLFTAISIAINSALESLRLPEVKRLEDDGGKISVKIIDRFEDAWTPDISAPIIHALVLIGGNMVLDPTYIEELCAQDHYLVASKTGGCHEGIIHDGSKALQDPAKFPVLFQDLQNLSNVIIRQLSFYLRNS